MIIYHERVATLTRRVLMGMAVNKAMCQARQLHQPLEGVYTFDIAAREIPGTLNTLRQRLAGLVAWHLEQGFPDPNKAPHVKRCSRASPNWANEQRWDTKSLIEYVGW